VSTTEVLRSRFPRAFGATSGLVTAPARGLDSVGHVAWFVVTAFGSIGHTLRYYRKETLRLIAEIGMGTGAMAVIGGTVAIVGFVTLSGSSLVAIQGFASLGNIGVEAFTGFFAALINVRIAAPVVAGVALAATVGAAATAELGAMRISEEIDALEVMAIPSVPYLITTRVIAGMFAVIPLYVLGLLSSYVSTELITTKLFHQSSGTYHHYFTEFLPRSDIFISFGKVMVFALIIILFHCYYGYRATGGPAGVGTAVGRSVRMVITTIVAIDLLLDLAIYGSSVTVRIAG
jgi:phospholipid/cholesterol/gamma-HCH transport system permease protein